MSFKPSQHSGAIVPGMRFVPHGHFIGLFIPNVLASYKGLQASSKLIWGRLAQYAGADGVCYPKIDTLAHELGCSERTVQRGLKELCSQGFIEIEQCYNESTRAQTSNRYYFLWHEIFIPSQPYISQQKEGVTNSRRGGDNMSSPGVTKWTPPPGDIMAPKENQYSFEKNHKKTTSTLPADVEEKLQLIAPSRKDPDAWEAKMRLLWQQGNLDLELLDKFAKKVLRSSETNISKHRLLITEIIDRGDGERFLEFLNKSETQIVTIQGLTFDKDAAQMMISSGLAQHV